MIRSLIRYSRYFFVTLLFREERKLLLKDFFFVLGFLKFDWNIFGREKKKIALSLAAEWLIENQRKGADGGFCTYRIVEGYTSSYPETSGYIIESLFAYSEKFQKAELTPDLIKCADWLISIQKSTGGWQSGYIQENKPEVVFNTGQVMRGLMQTYRFSKDEKYLLACIRAADWLCEIQEEDGSWQRYAFMNVKRVYETYVSAPLLQLWQLTGNEQYKIKATKNIEWVLREKINKKGWFEDCDNTIKHNDRPILHTIAYTLDGLIDSIIILKCTNLLEQVKKGADNLLDIFNRHNYLWGRYSKDWNPSEAFICTGGAQISIVWLKLYKLTGEKKYFDGAVKMNSLLCFIQSFTLDMDINIRGALQGSFPIWGRYEPFAFPNWATKYLLDALMLEAELIAVDDEE